MSDKGTKEKELTEAERVAIVSLLIGKETSNGTLPRGSLDEVAKKFAVARATVSRLWNRCTTSRSEGFPVIDEIKAKKENR